MEENTNQSSIERAAVKYTGQGLLVGGILGSLIGSLFAEEFTWGGMIGAAAGLILGAIVDTYQEKASLEETKDQEIPAVRLIAYLYFLGAAVLLLALPFNHQKIGNQIANLHGLPALAGIPILVLTSGLGFLIGYGLYKMTSWGYWLTLGYLMYLFIAPHLLGSDVPSIFGNIIWPLFGIVYLILNRKAYFKA